MKLHEKIKAQEKIITAYEKGIEELINYLSLPKFYIPNNSVNVSDIFLRLSELKNNIIDIEYQEGL